MLELMLKRIALLVAVLCPVFFFCPFLYSQANGSLSGNVADKTGSVIAGASVRITSQATGLTRETKTDDSGHYLVPLLPPSIYTIHVESQGFKTTEQKDIRLQVAEQLEDQFARSSSPSISLRIALIRTGPAQSLPLCANYFPCGSFPFYRALF